MLHVYSSKDCCTFYCLHCKKKRKKKTKFIFRRNGLVFKNKQTTAHYLYYFSISNKTDLGSPPVPLWSHPQPHLYSCLKTAFILMPFYCVLAQQTAVNACHPPVPSSVEVTIELRRKPSWGRACACCLFWLRRLLNHSWILAIPVHAWLTCPRSVRQVRSYWLDEQNVGTQQLFYWLN